MTRSQRIKKLVKLKENNERIAARGFAASQKILDEYYQRLKQMLEYRQEYLGFMKMSTTTVSITSLRERQGFILQIDEAIKILKQEIENIRNMNDRERENWVQHKQQLDVMENIFERTRLIEKNQFAQREQRQLDEQSQRVVSKN